MMNRADDDRRTIEELKTLYFLEPTLRDVIVEGRTDASIIRWYVEQHERDCRVFAVDDRVTVPSDVVRKYGLDVGCRGRVIALALEISDSAGDSVTVVADSDFRCIHSESWTELGSILLTDPPSMEVYALTERTLEKFLRLVLTSAREFTGRNLLSILVPILRDLFIARAAMIKVLPETSLVEKFERCMNVDGDRYSIDVKELVRRSAGSAEKAEKVLAEFERIKSILDSTDLILARGHDIARVIVQVLTVRGTYANSDFVERSLMGCLELIDLDGHPLFARLLERLSA